MCADDAEFRREFEAVREQVLESAGAHDAEVHRRWRPSDTKVVDAWVGGRYPYGGETWEQFVGRVSACRPGAGAAPARRGDVAVFTSATPTAIWTGRALGVTQEQVRRLAAVLLNTSYTVLRLRDDGQMLLTFNAVPHLHAPELRTLR